MSLWYCRWWICCIFGLLVKVSESNLIWISQEIWMRHSRYCLLQMSIFCLNVGIQILNGKFSLWICFTSCPTHCLMLSRNVAYIPRWRILNYVDRVVLSINVVKLPLVKNSSRIDNSILPVFLSASLTINIVFMICLYISLSSPCLDGPWCLIHLADVLIIKEAQLIVVT